LEKAYRRNCWTDFNTQYLKTRVSVGTAYFRGLERWRHNFRGQNPQKLPPKGREYAFFSQISEMEKIAISRRTVADAILYAYWGSRTLTENMQKYKSRDLLLNFGTPLILRILCKYQARIEVQDANEKFAKVDQKGQGARSREFTF